MSTTRRGWLELLFLAALIIVVAPTLTLLGVPSEYPAFAILLLVVGRLIYAAVRGGRPQGAYTSADYMSVAALLVAAFGFSLAEASGMEFLALAALLCLIVVPPALFGVPKWADNFKEIIDHERFPDSLRSPLAWVAVPTELLSAFAFWIGLHLVAFGFVNAVDALSSEAWYAGFIPLLTVAVTLALKIVIYSAVSDVDRNDASLGGS